MQAQTILAKIEDKIEKDICGRLFDMDATINFALFTRSLGAITKFGQDEVAELEADNDLAVALNSVIVEANIILKIVGEE